MKNKTKKLEIIQDIKELSLYKEENKIRTCPICNIQHYGDNGWCNGCSENYLKLRHDELHD